MNRSEEKKMKDEMLAKAKKIIKDKIPDGEILKSPYKAVNKTKRKFKKREEKRRKKKESEGVGGPVYDEKDVHGPVKIEEFDVKNILPEGARRVAASTATDEVPSL